MSFIQRNQILIIFALVTLIMMVVVIASAPRYAPERASLARGPEPDFTNIVAPAEGKTLPVVWGDFGKRLIESGVIDAQKFEALSARYGELGAAGRQMLYGVGNGKIVINRDNAGTILNLLWAFGLGNKNPILEEGPMQDARYGAAARFASTGGWVIASGDPMSHYSRHPFVVLTLAQQDLVERVSRNIYRPCCGNSAYFPDCNHGMAMLGLLELMASQQVSEDDMYRAALAVNSYWFTNRYAVIAQYFSEQGNSWGAIDPKRVLSADFSSAAGFQRVFSRVSPRNTNGGSSCGVQ